ncbi:MAG: HlyD family efflux transporter periplasmic adaptor subunit, partial [Clostridiaceae bacterium]|nr:HlyD family efflux transporter periplasmic adaptor subunit [Clostridiaceae bacterium]
RIVSPVSGTVLNRYAEAGELATIGTPLFKIADIETIFLRAYVTNDQLAQIKLNGEVTVRVDDGHGGMKPYKGRISWISDKSEFTPKTIQTKNERANLVYALKIAVPNDGFLKIGMYGEVKL